ncbi:hypothetical protein DFJ58DRAFT_840207 [Suillus subalutaceus]|uniref:uncharacterized protein n=1 Tax=Suillus subalutaceus TaxID=48586 RepID=UPI001B885A95|nr:uncharacterized protein DFJ58DRAFT_840207 [Suillus subalutaceus]KAG1859342.1 hypothetical protein DFJ58DRAFT_840207 [Suillus subalutaceus]
MFHSDKLPMFVFYSSAAFVRSDRVIHQADVVGVDDGWRPFILFFCLSWFQKKEKKQEPRPVYDDELEDDEEEENALDPVALPPPRVQHEEIELKPIASQSQPEAGPSRLAVTDHFEAQSS